VLRLKDAGVATGCARPLRPRKICATSAASLRSISKDSWRQLDQLEDVTTEGRHILYLFVTNRAANRRRFRIEGLGCARNHHALLDWAKLQLEVKRVQLFGNNLHVLDDLLFESSFRYGDPEGC